MTSAEGRRLGVPSAVALVGFAITLYLFYPGFMNWDSAYQLFQAEKGRISNPHPPIMAYLWMLTNQVTFGPAGMLVVHAAVYWTGVALIGIALARTVTGRCGIVLLLGFLPPSFGLLPMVMKDVGAMSALMLLTGVALCATPRRRFIALPVAVLMAFYASAVRINVLPCVAPLLWLVLSAVSAREAPRGLRQLAGLGAILVLTLAGVLAVNNVGVIRQPYRTVVPLWDLARISMLAQEMLVPDYALVNPYITVPSFKVSHNRADAPSMQWKRLTPEQVSDISSRWLAAIIAFPTHYLDHRWHVTYRIFFDPIDPLLHFTMPTIFYPSSVLIERGMGFEKRSGYTEVYGALQFLSRTPIYRPWTYVLVSLLVVAWCFAGASERRLEAGFVAVSGLLYVTPLPLIAPSVDFRYTIWLFPATAIGALLLLRVKAQRPKPASNLDQASPLGGAA